MPVQTRWTKYEKPAKDTALGLAVNSIMSEAWELFLIDEEDKPAAPVTDAMDPLPLMLATNDVVYTQAPSDEAFKQAKGARMKKAMKFFRDKPLEAMMLLLLTITPLNAYIKEVFKMGKDEMVTARTDFVPPIFRFANLDISPAVKVLHEYMVLLEDCVLHQLYFPQ